MRAADFETLHPNTPIRVLPITIIQTPSRTSPLFVLALALPAALTALTPVYLIAAHAAQNTQVFVERPQTSLQIAFAFMMWSLVFGWPIFKRTRRMGSQRLIAMTATDATVIDSGLLGDKTWREPLSAYNGLAHHVRSSLSGTRHELLLIHPNPARSLLLCTAQKITQSEIEITKTLLGCREIAPQAFYRNTQTTFQRGFATITPQLPSRDGASAVGAAI